jgi:putative cardiolipin synthase
MLIVAILGGCATFPPGSEYPRTASSALAHPEVARLGRQFINAAREHNGKSGFRIIPVGADGFLNRMQMINAAERTLDLQYFIFRGDETGRQLTGAVLHAADRGVRVRVLVDDVETVAGDEQIAVLEAHNTIEIRIFNPFAYCGHSTFQCGLVSGTGLLRISCCKVSVATEWTASDDSARPGA